MEPTKAVKPGIYTSEFWILAVISVVTWVSHAAASGALPLDLTVKIQAVLAVAYKIARGLAKAG